MFPGIYDRLRGGPDKTRPEEIAHSFFLAGIESRATRGFRNYPKNLHIGKGGAQLLHMSLQFDGVVVRIHPFPDNSRYIDEKRIYGKSGFKVNSVEKIRNFYAEYVARDAVEIEHAPPLPYG